MTNENKLNRIIEIINELDPYEVKYLNNNYFESYYAKKSNYNNPITYRKHLIFENEEEFFQVNFRETMDLIKAVAKAAAKGDYDSRHDFVKLDAYGKLKSLETLKPSDLPKSPEVIAKYVLENERDFNWIFNILDGYGIRSYTKDEDSE